MEKTFYNKGDEFYSSGRLYSVVTCIKSTRWSEVYKIQRKQDGKNFLLKVLIKDKMPKSLLLNDKPRIIRYLDTSNISQQLSVYDWGALDTNHDYMISRYFTKGLLSDRLREDALKFHTAINITLDLAKTLASLQAYDHNSNVIRPMRHGDICPNNIMYDFDEKGDYKTYLIDIEHISYIYDDKHDAALASEVGYIDNKYCAPEVWDCEAVYNSDVFSLGIILYECCFGEYPFPFNAEEYQKILDSTQENIDFNYLKKIMHACPEYLNYSNCGGIVRILIHLLRGMLEIDPQKRLSMPAVISQLNILKKVTKIHNIELTNEACFDEAIINTYNVVSKEHEDTYTLHESRRPEDFRIDNFEDFRKEFELEENLETEEIKETKEIDYSPLIKLPGKNAKGFKDVAGMNELKETVSKKVLFFIKNPELAAEYKITPPNGMLLYGPPGCGKTFFAEKFAEESGFAFALVKASDLGSTWIHGTQKKINELFNEAKSKAPCILCFDEFDAFVPDRSQTHNVHYSGEVNEFLSQLNNCGNERIFIIATTNNPEGIDPAVLRSGRLEHKVFIPAPDFEARKAVFKMGVLGRPCTASIDFDKLAQLTEGYVTSDIALIINDAAMNAAYSRTFISQTILEESISGYKPSVSKKVLQEHEEIRCRMESDKRNQNRIGYK